jgi:hypothetical protein
VKCKYCGEKGHWASFCYNKGRCLCTYKKCLNKAYYMDGLCAPCNLSHNFVMITKREQNAREETRLCL